MDKLSAEIKNLNLSYRAAPVEYYNKENINGPISLFQKVQEYKYQNEYRVVVQNKKQEPLKISLVV